MPALPGCDNEARSRLPSFVEYRPPQPHNAARSAEPSTPKLLPRIRSTAAAGPRTASIQGTCSAPHRSPAIPQLGTLPGVDATTTATAAAPVSMPREGLAWAFTGVVMFSFSVPLTKEAVGGFSPFLTATGRAVLAGLLAAVLLAARRAPLPPVQQRRPLVFTMLGAVFGWPILLALALERTTSAHVAVIAAFMPLTTALIAVLRTHERVTWQFWAAAGTGTAALVVFALSRAGGNDDLVADLLVVGAVLASSWCYVEGATVTRAMPGWQVISWVVVLALPLTVPLSAALWWFTHDSYSPSGTEWLSVVLLGVSSMYLGFFAWYRGLSLAGIARGGQVQQLQALLTLLWSALFLGEHVTPPTVLVALTVIGSVVWAQRARVPPVVTPQE
jgi:drug/metabolite transporter (DMT)-like permease